MGGRASLTWLSRRCWWQVRSNGQDGPYVCHEKPTVERYGRMWCEQHDPVVDVLRMVQATTSEALLVLGSEAPDATERARSLFASRGLGEWYEWATGRAA